METRKQLLRAFCQGCLQPVTTPVLVAESGLAVEALAPGMMVSSAQRSHTGRCVTPTQAAQSGEAAEDTAETGYGPSLSLCVLHVWNRLQQGLYESATARQTFQNVLADKTSIYSHTHRSAGQCRLADVRQARLGVADSGCRLGLGLFHVHSSWGPN